MLEDDTVNFVTKVLIVDDTPANLRLLSDTLSQRGYNVQCAISGALALIGVKADRPDVILLDIRMPQMDGFEVCRQLKADKNTREIPVIFLSALDEPFDKVRAFQVGGVDYITKPFQPEEVIARIENHLALQRSRAAVLRLNAELERRVEERTQALVKLNLELQASEERFRTVANAVPVLIWMSGADGQCNFVNQRWLDFTGHSLEQALGEGRRSNIHPTDRPRYQKVYQAAFDYCQPFTLEYRLQDANLTYRWMLETGIPLFRDEQEFIGFIGSAVDIHDRKQAEEQIIHNALHDSLTDLPNRALLMERLELSLNRVIRYNHTHFAVLFLDIDRFKLINDSLGHLAGDQLLIQFASRLEKIIRPTDLLARLGGDEFVLLLEDIHSVQEAIHLANRILDQVQLPFFIEEREVFLTVSIGIVLSNLQYVQGAELLRDADTAMYQAKIHGKARYEVFNLCMHDAALKQLQLENDLRKALKQQEFVMYYQPIINLHTEEMVGLEALIRWQRPLQGIVPPDEFIPVAEETGIIVSLGKWVLQTVCDQIQHWQQQFNNSSLRVSVNLSVKQLQDSNFLQQIDQILESTGLSGHSLTLEITESMLIDNVEEVITLLAQLRERSILIDIDDFGTGYSSLNYLRRFPIHALKVDKSFTQSIALNTDIVQAIVSLSRALKIDVIVEGIETVDQMEILKEIGCEYGQGYYLGRPLPPSDVEKLLL